MKNVVKLGHTPDPDDAFLTYAIVKNKIGLKDVDIVEVVLDIETLNKLVILKKLEISAISVATYLLVSKDYIIIPYGASVGYSYGPKLIINRRYVDRGKITVAVPGLYTTARVLTEAYLRENGREYEIVDVQFDKILTLLNNDVVECGVLIHEEQILDIGDRYIKIDLGEWWFNKFKLPIPLGINVIRRDVDNNIVQTIVEAFRKSIEYAYKNIDEVLTYSLNFSRIRDRDKVLNFIKMYVNDRELNYRSDEIKSIEKLHEICRDYRIEPFYKHYLDIKIATI